MNEKELREMLRQVAEGSLSPEDAALKLREAPFTDIDIAKPDHHRSIRQGIGEIVYGAGKTPEQIDRIAHSLWEGGQKTVLITRMSREAADCFNRDIPFTYSEEGRIGIVGSKKAPDGDGMVLVMTAGTSDIPVAEEAALTAETLGNEVCRVYDVGVSGIHRLLSHVDEIM